MVLRLNEWIGNRWNEFSWGGGKKSPYGELMMPHQMRDVEATPYKKEKTINTTVDCYATGNYVTDNGKVFSIRERYSITVTYSNSSIIEAMSRVRARIMAKFAEDNPNFMITDVFVPELFPEFKKGYEPMFVAKGGRLFRYMTRLEEGRLLLRTSKDIYKNRAEKLIKDYGIRRREAQIRRL
jgi:hypothetical protein